MEARSQSVAHPNENEFHFQLECLLMEDDAANPLAVPMTSSQHVYEVRPRSDKRGVDLIFDALTRSGSRPFDQFYCGNWLSPLAELTGCGRSVPILAKR